MARRSPRYYGSTFASTNATSPEVQGHTYVCAQSKMLKVSEKMNWYVKKVRRSSCSAEHRGWRKQ
jgi:hypothetical protein